MPRLKLTKKNIDEKCLPVEGRAQISYWDTDVKGFGLVVGKRTKTYVLQRSLTTGRQRRITIGRHGTWTPEMARKRARELIVDIDRGVDPVAEKRRQEARGITLVQAENEHYSRLRAKGGSERTVQQMTYEFKLHMSDWRRRPLGEITKQECRARHKRLSESSGPYAANRVFRHFRAIYNSALKVHDLPPLNPAIAVEWNKERRRQEPVPWERLREWRIKVGALNPIRRDYNFFVLFTGLRSTDAATVKWSDVDFQARTLHRPNPKGGEDRAFTVPLSGFVMELLKQRREENEVLFGDDRGWVFPTRSKDGTFKPLVYRRWDNKRPGCTPHRLRDTYTTACQEAGLSAYDIDVLTNHRPPTGSVTAGYIRQSVEHLRDCQEQVTAYLREKMA